MLVNKKKNHKHTVTYKQYRKINKCTTFFFEKIPTKNFPQSWKM